jgi:FkbM family methyltransferase
LIVEFGANPRFQLVNKALGAAIGTDEISISKQLLTASLSPEHIRAAQSRKYKPLTLWEKAGSVSVTTLDALIQQYGSPAFVKIDAEGFEYEIMRGLSHPLTALSFEFVPTYLEPALKSIDALLRFGTMRLNYVVGERFEWMLDEWVTADELIPTLKSYAPETHFIYGDVYVRFEDEQRSHNTHSFRRTPWTNNKQTH